MWLEVSVARPILSTSLYITLVSPFPFIPMTEEKLTFI